MIYGWLFFLGFLWFVINGFLWFSGRLFAMLDLSKNVLLVLFCNFSGFLEGKSLVGVVLAFWGCAFWLTFIPLPYYLRPGRFVYLLLRT